ncbi:MAG: MipA/OmpV family protein [Alphaproteobacteria bacterium]|nr:MAG: MipA/OmpV family protein [Alphaproteobacteria bacterium]
MTLAATPVLAQGAAPGVPLSAQRTAPPPRAWTLGVGFAPLYAPAWQGSRDQALSIFPDLRLNYRDAVFASIPDGLGWNAVNRDGWKLGPLAKLRFGRQESNGGSPFLVAGGSEALRGMGDVGVAGEVGGFAQYSFAGRKARVRAEVRQGFGGHDGVIADVLLGWNDRFGAPTSPWLWSTSVRATFAGRDYVQTYFGVTPGQAAATGLDAFAAGGGLVSTGLNASLTKPLGSAGRGGAITLFGGYDRLADAAADSSLIRDRGRRDQFSVGLSYGYRFSWD